MVMLVSSLLGGRRRHWASAAALIVRTMGPATAAPVVSETPPGWPGTTTATATLGLLAGAKAIIQSVVDAPLLVCAVPVLAATSSEAGKIPAAVPYCATFVMSASTAEAVAGEVAW